MPDFSRPGGDGILDSGFEPGGFKDWRIGTVHTVRPVMLEPLACGARRRIMALFRCAIDSAENFSGYAALYRRAERVLRARANEIRCADAEATLHTWIAGQFWHTFEARGRSFAGAYLTLGLLAARPGEALPGEQLPQGEPVPPAGDLERPGGKPSPPETPHPDEIYNDFDFRREGNDEPAMFSYGEYLPAAEIADFEPLVRRAEARARWHGRLFENALEIVRREWYTTSSPDLGVVHIYFRISNNPVCPRD